MKALRLKLAHWLAPEAFAQHERDIQWLAEINKLNEAVIFNFQKSISGTHEQIEWLYFKAWDSMTEEERLDAKDQLGHPVPCSSPFMPAIDEFLSQA